MHQFHELCTTERTQGHVQNPLSHTWPHLGHFLQFFKIQAILLSSSPFSSSACLYCSQVSPVCQGVRSVKQDFFLQLRQVMIGFWSPPSWMTPEPHPGVVQGRKSAWGETIARRHCNVCWFDDGTRADTQIVGCMYHRHTGSKHPSRHRADPCL